MRIPANLSAKLAIFWLVFFMATPAYAAIDNAGLLDNVLARYSTAASTWAGVITSAATWLFWTLALISIVWTFGLMALRKADIGEFFVEFIRFTMFTGFFWWLLMNGPAFASSIYDSLRQIAGDATGLGPGLTPSGIVDIGFAIFDKVLDQSTLWSPVDSFAGIIMALIILVILALIGINMLLLLTAGWVLAYGGVFFLGFGGSRWTSDIAINYYKSVLGLAAQLLAMVLLIGIGKSFLDDYYNAMNEGVSLKEMGVLLIVAVILLALVNKVPAMLAGVISGAGVGAVGSAGAGTMLAGAGVAAAAAATGGAVMAAGASNMAGGSQAIMAAFNKANDNVAAGTDIMSSFSGSSGKSDEAASSDDSAGTGDTPFAKAAGFSGNTSSSGNAGESEESSGGNTERPSEQSSSGDRDRGSEAELESQNSEAQSSTQTSQKSPASDTKGGGGIFAGAAKAGRIAADTGANLAKGTSAVMKEKAQNRLSDTAGGKIAAAIKKQGGGKAESGVSENGSEGSEKNHTSPSFGNDSVGGLSKREQERINEVTNFVNKD
ncbi:P-type conjugative transfer protein TrbL [Marinobacter sp.]|uniref:P-type conjugative transfer protein TrbL n=1 Tax=Marinobacter sp. TaxID=50741 RepID=UPI003A94CB4A